MLCEKCNKVEATFDAPGKWCDDCWDAWWLEDCTPEEREETEGFLFVCRAFQDLGQDISDDEALGYVMRKCRGTLNPSKVIEDIRDYRELEND